MLMLTLSKTDSITEFCDDYLVFHVLSDRSIWVCFNMTLLAPPIESELFFSTGTFLNNYAVRDRKPHF